MKIRENEVVIFNVGDSLISLVSGQDIEKVRKYDRKTGRVHNGKHQDGQPSYYDIKFPDGFCIKRVEESHLKPIRARRFKGRY